jgi:ABC-type branched-chain amino acid transport systems, periplasmic component
MKKILSVALILCLVLALAPMAFADNPVVKIGVFEPQSGDNGAGGKQEVLGVEYAHFLRPTVTVGGKEYTVQLVNVDNQSDSSKAVTAAQELVSAGVSVVLGSYGSGASMAGGDVFAAAEVPAIGLSCTNPSVTALCDYYWRICFLDPFQGSVMANFANSLGAKKAYVLTMLGEDYGNGLGHYFSNAFKDLGGEVVAETFPEGTSDFTAYINNAIHAGADCVFAPCATTYASLIIDQAASLNVSFPLLAGDTWESSVILDAAKGKNIQVYVSTFFDENDDAAAAADFVSGFKAWLNANADKKTNNGGNDIVAAVSALGFDGYNVALAAIEAAGAIDAAAIAEALPELTYEGAVTGTISFDEIGDAKKDMAYVKYANPETGAFDFVKTQSVAGL